MPLKLAIITTGGTIDKVYYDAKSDYQIGDPQIKAILDRVGATIEFEVKDIFQKDSLDITEEDRQSVLEEVQRTEAEYIILTHGTDTMVETAKLLRTHVSGKTIVLVGSLTPARFRESDAEFNIGVAVGAVQSLAHGVYLAMNGVVFDPSKVRKNRAENRFEPLA